MTSNIFQEHNLELKTAQSPPPPPAVLVIVIILLLKPLQASGEADSR